ncbi:MAG: DcaP family trimeric outer membrane transporter [Candidatus Neomarinimicrobiota bacterium]
MRRYTTIMLIALSLAALVGPLAADDAGVSTSISGFIKFDGFYDTRQVVSAREGHFLLYPAGISEDAEGNDLNAVNNINMVNFQTRLRADITAPDALGAKVTGLIEGDFFGASNGNENEFRLRHSFVKLNWGASQLQIGQYWSPLFSTAVFPQVVSFNTGMPIQPFARNPQIRYTTKVGENLTVIGAATMQRDAFQEISGRTKQQQSGLPGLHLFGELGTAKALIGGGGHLRFIRHSAGADVFSSTVFTAYGKLVGDKLAMRAKTIYGGDLADQLMLGGYAILTDTVTTDVEYFPTRNLSTWIDVMTSGGAVSLGVFAGYSTNLGIGSDLEQDVIHDFSAARSPNIAGLWRVSPRAVYNAGKLRFAFELEITSALYAGAYKADLSPKTLSSDERVTNVRGLLATYLFF